MLERREIVGERRLPVAGLDLDRIESIPAAEMHHQIVDAYAGIRPQQVRRQQRADLLLEDPVLRARVQRRQRPRVQKIA